VSRYESSLMTIYSVFATEAWKAMGITAHPSSIVPENPGTEYIRLSVIPSGMGVNGQSVSGVLIIGIFVKTVDSPKRSYSIADSLDSFLMRKSVENLDGDVVQFLDSVADNPYLDKAKPSLTMMTYSIPFSFFGVN